MHSPLRSAPFVVLLFALEGCSWLPSWLGGAPAVANTAIASPLLIEDAGLLATRDRRAEIGIRLNNASSRPLWVGVRVQTPGGRTDCVMLKELPPQVHQLFTCPQTKVFANVDYVVVIDSYRDPGLNERLAPLQTLLRFNANDLSTIGQP